MSLEPPPTPRSEQEILRPEVYQRIIKDREKNEKEAEKKRLQKEKEDKKNAEKQKKQEKVKDEVVFDFEDGLTICIFTAEFYY